MFIVGIPVMAILLVLGPILVPEFKNDGAGRLDLVSALLSLAAVLGFIYGVKELARYGVQPLPLVVGLGGIALGVAFARRQFRLDDPLLDLSMFRNRAFSVMLTGLLLYGLVGASSMMFITQHFQSVSGLTPLQAALALLPGMATATASATISPIAARRFRPAYLIGCGVLGVAATFVWFSRLDASSGPAVLIIGFAIIGLCQGPLISLGTNLVVRAAPPEKAGSSSSMAQTANESGAALGVALLGSVGGTVYGNQMAAAMPPGVPDGAAAAARDTVASAVAEATSLPEPVGSALLAAAREAFTDGLNVYALVSAALLVLVAIFVTTQLKHVPPTGAGNDVPAGDASSTAAVNDPSTGYEA